jgi:hypothetical protein
VSATSHVFFDSSLDMDCLIAELAYVLKAEVLPPTHDIPSYGFLIKVCNVVCSLIRNEFQLDYLSQQIYRFELHIFTIGALGDDERINSLIEGAKCVFEKLKADGRFPVMSVFDFEEVLGEFIPDR